MICCYWYSLGGNQEGRGCRVYSDYGSQELFAWARTHGVPQQWMLSTAEGLLHFDLFGSMLSKLPPPESRNDVDEAGYQDALAKAQELRQARLRQKMSRWGLNARGRRR